MTVLLAQTIPLADTWSMHGGDVGFGWWLIMVLFWGAVVALVVWMLRGGNLSTLRGSLESVEPTADEILQRRLADGSLSVEEYERRRRLLDEARRDSAAVPGASRERGDAAPTSEQLGR